MSTYLACLLVIRGSKTVRMCRLVSLQCINSSVYFHSSQESSRVVHAADVAANLNTSLETLSSDDPNTVSHQIISCVIVQFSLCFPFVKQVLKNKNQKKKKC